MENAQRTEKHLDQVDAEEVTGAIYWPKQRVLTALARHG